MKQVEQLLSVLQQSDASELEVQAEGWRLRVRRQVVATPPAMVVAAEKPAAPPQQPASVWVRAPLVGFFQPRPQPLQVGDRVQRGEVVCLVRAMGLPNEVRSPVDGRVVEVLVEEGVPVEYGQPLYRLEEEHEAVA